MANPIKASDLYQDDGAIQAAIEQLKSLQSTYEALLDSTRKDAVRLEVEVKKISTSTQDYAESLQRAAARAEELQRQHRELSAASKSVEDSIKKTEKAQDQQNEAIAEGVELTEEVEKALARYAEALDDNKVKTEAIRLATQKMNQINKLEAKLAMSRAGSYNALSAQYSILKIKLNDMTKAERESTKAGQEMEKQAYEIYQQMKALQEATGKHTLSVGDYEKATRNLLNELRDMPGAAGRAGQSVGDLGDQFRALIRNPVVAVIAAIVGALSTLGAAFKQSEAGARLFAKVGGTIQGLWSELVGLVSAFSERVMAAFKNPQQAMRDFWTALKENIVNRFEGLINLVRRVGDALGALWNRDLEALREAAQGAGQALVAIGTGLDAEQQKAFAESIRQTTQEVTASAKAFSNLAVRRREIEAQNRRLATSLEELITREEVLNTIRDDASKSLAEREEASARLFQAQLDRAKVEQQIARNNLSLLDQELKLRRSNGENVAALEEQRLAAYQALAQAERSYTLAVRENEKERDVLKQDRLERDLDILIDGFDNQKTINERIIADDTRTFGERRATLEATQRLFDESFAKQIETIQQFTGVAVDANDLIATSDAVALNAKIRSLGLSEIIEGRLLEIIRDRRTGIQDLAEAERELAQAETVAAAATLEKEKAFRASMMQAAMDAFEQEQELQRSRLALAEATAAEIAQAELEMERDKLRKLLELNKQYQGDLTGVQIETIENQIQAIDARIAEGGQVRGLAELLGISEDQQQVIGQAFAFAKSQLDEFMQKRVEAANQAVQRSADEVQAAQAMLQIEIEAAENGFAANVERARKELDLAKQNQKKALEQQRQAQRAQQQIQAATQAANLVTASSKILADFKLPFALLALAVMWGAFATAQVKASQLTKKEYGRGGFEFLDYGGSHASGNDNPLAYTRDGRERRAERGEAFAVFSRRAVGQYRDVLPGLVEAINQGRLERRMPSLEASGLQSLIVPGTDMRRTERELEAIRRQGEKKVYTDSKGRTVEVLRNRKTVYHA